MPVSYEHEIFMKGIHRRRIRIRIAQVLLFVLLIALWEIAARLHWIDPFIFSQPSRIVATTTRMMKDGSLFLHTGVTFGETLVSFALGTIIGTIIAVLLWMSEFAAKVLDPYLVLLNALPKTALGPIIIVWIGGTIESIIVMALLFSVVVTILTVYTSFKGTDPDKIKLLKTFGATKLQLLRKVVLPANLASIISVLKVNIGMSLVGVIVGEFLVSKAGLGYLIIYGGQVFQMDLVMTSIIVLAVMAAVLYAIVSFFEKRVK